MKLSQKNLYYDHQNQISAESKHSTPPTEGWVLLNIGLQNQLLSRAEHSPAFLRLRTARISEKVRVGFLPLKKDDRLIASNARSDLLGKNHALTRNSSLNFFVFLLLARHSPQAPSARASCVGCEELLVLPFVGTKGSGNIANSDRKSLIHCYFCLTKVTKNNPDDENLLRPSAKSSKWATTRFCEQNVPIS